MPNGLKWAKGMGATWTRQERLAHAPPNPRVWGGGAPREVGRRP
jgi:hypothetical protein